MSDPTSTEKPTTVSSTTSGRRKAGTAEMPKLPDAPKAVDVPEIVEVPAATAEIDNTEVLAPEGESTAQTPVVTTPPVQTVYVEAPTPPRKKSNRGVGALIAVLSAIIFAALLAVVIAIIGVALGGPFQFSFLGVPQFSVPVLFFLVGFVLLVLIVNRAPWWTHVFGSIFVALFVYFGTVGTLLVLDGIIAKTPAQAGVQFAVALTNPVVIAAALISREVALWMGFAISARGRRLKVRNAHARAAYETELAEKRAEYDRARAASAA